MYPDGPLVSVIPCPWLHFWLDENHDGCSTAVVRQPIILTCDPQRQWLDLFIRHAVRGEEVDLISFNCELDTGLCERVARAHNMTFTTLPDVNTGFLRRQ